MLRQLFTASCLIVLSAVPAVAVNWEYLGTPTNHSFRYYIDLDSITKEGEFFYYNDAYVDDSTNFYTGNKLSCRTAKRIVLSKTEIDHNGNVLRSFDIPLNKQIAVQVLPGRIDALAYERLCNN
ncbi:hypothetical protein IQ244_14675 [Nostoc sp. LEGE 06077]|uniref:hypothetical protein n=1 Tax=Nostoc sp. LEGE 06077 TaxID=915325 RepID=UPI00187E1FE7|nr:hypothetical protein [Nostoc sp. LEGE 06077]MBE9207740.1 hypothetical protein [Nostoc sp. LEGE 06077]